MISKNKSPNSLILALLSPLLLTACGDSRATPRGAEARPTSGLELTIDDDVLGLEATCDSLFKPSSTSEPLLVDVTRVVRNSGSNQAQDIRQIRRIANRIATLPARAHETLADDVAVTEYAIWEVLTDLEGGFYRARRTQEFDEAVRRTHRVCDRHR